MALTAQSQTSAKAPPENGREIPDPPRMPEEVLRRFPQMNDWQRRQDQWWETMKLLLREKDEALEKLRATVNSLA